MSDTSNIRLVSHLNTIVRALGWWYGEYKFDPNLRSKDNCLGKAVAYIAIPLSPPVYRMDNQR